MFYAQRTTQTAPGTDTAPSPLSLVSPYLFVYTCFSTSLSLVGNSGRLTWVIKAHLPQEQLGSRFLSLCVQYFCVSKQLHGSQCLGLSTCAQMLMYAIARGGCTDTVRESALKADSGRKIPCCTGDSNPRWYFQSDALLTYPCPLLKPFAKLRRALTA